MNINLWAKLRLYKNQDGSIIFINLEDSDISELMRHGTDFINGDRFTLHPGEMVTINKSLCSIEYIGSSNNSIIFKYEWWDSIGYVTIPFGVHDIRICTYATDEKGLVPLKTEEEYGTDLEFALSEFTKFLELHSTPTVINPCNSTVYIEIDTKMTTFINGDANKEVLRVDSMDGTGSTIYKYTKLQYGVFIKLDTDFDIYDNKCLSPSVIEIYCKEGYENQLAERIIYMLQGEIDEKIEIAML